MKILVTGGAGFIGSCFIKHILKKYPDYKVTNLDALTYCGNLDNIAEVNNNPNYKFVRGNICDKNLVSNLVKEVDCIVNFAAESHVDNSIKNPELFIETNVKGTMTLLNVSREFGIEKFLQISTDEVYGSLSDEGYFDETTPIAPNSPYSSSKACADLISMAFYRTYKLPVLITRCSNNYGPYQYPEKLIPFFISRILENKSVTLYGDGMNIRDWLYVSDHCEALDLVLHNGTIGEIYNIGAHNEKTNLDITKQILKYLGKDESYIEFVNDRPGHDRRYAMSNEKITKELGWNPKVNFNEGLKYTIEWYLNNSGWISNIKKRKNI